MNASSHLLVGVDFSPSSRNALLTALRLAKARGAKVTALHVMDPSLAREVQNAHGYTDAALHDFMVERLHSFLAAPEFTPDMVSFEFASGPDFETLVHWCNKLRPDLLVLGSRGRTHARHQLGAIAAKCARQAPADVLLVREEARHPFRHIVACVDFSETSARALQRAAGIAEIDGSRLDCLHVNQSALAMALDYSGFVPVLEMPEQATTPYLMTELEKFSQPLIPPSVAPRFRALVPERVNVRDAIYEHATEAGADLVVLGTRGVAGLRALVMGTTAERIITHSPCSVLAVKPEGYAFQLT